MSELPPEHEPVASNPPVLNLARSVRWLLGGALVVLLGAAALILLFDEGSSLRDYADDVELTLHQHQNEVAAIAHDTAFLRRQVHSESTLSQQQLQTDADAILALSQQPYNISLYERDSLVFWTSNRVFLPTSTPPSRVPAMQLRALKNGRYIISRESVELLRGDTFELVALIPVKNAYTLPSEYLRNTFTGNPSIPDAIDLSEVPTGFPIREVNDEVVGYLHASRAFHDWRYQAAALSLLLFGLGLLAYGTSLGVQYARLRWGSLAAGGLALATVVAVRGSMTIVDWAHYFDGLGILSKVLHTPVVNGSLGGLVVDVLIALGFVTFFHRHYKRHTDSTHTDLRRYAATGAHYFAIVAAAFGLTHAFAYVVTDSSLVFDFNNVLNLNIISVIAVLALLVLMLGTFLLAHRLMLDIEKIELTKYVRFTALLTALTLSVPFAILIGSPLPLPHFYVGALIFVVVYDMFVDSGESNVLWLFFWLVIIAMYSAALLFTFNEQKDLAQRVEYAKVLSEPRDTIAEAGLAAFVKSLRADITFQQALARQDSMVRLRQIAPALERKLIDQGYLYNNFAYRVYGYDKVTNGSFLHSRDNFEASAARQRYDQATEVDSHIRYTLNDHASLSYIIRLTSDLLRNPTRSVFLEFDHSPRAPSRVFTELLVGEHYRHLKALPNYDYALYRNETLVEEAGPTHAIQLQGVDLPSEGNWIARTDSRYSSVLYAGMDDTFVVIGKEMGGYWRPMSLFSYLFVWCILITLVLSLANTYVEFLPRAVDITWLGKPDLKTKIQVGIIALVLLSFAMIGYVTVLYFHDSTDAYHDNRLNRKVASILRNAEHEISLLSELSDVDLGSLERITNPISGIHHMDVNIYDLKGDLLSSSETDIFERGVIAPKMGAYAYQMMAKRGLQQVVQVESVGDLTYRTAYVPVRMPDGEMIAFMGLPYYSKQRDLRDDVSSFMGTLLNVYVFLLLIAGAIAITVANSITKPLSELGAKIRKFKVDETNEPLTWHARDELGALIGEFNQMLVTVEENAKELDNARRDAAWREMAQQVAHEIKNPLTPMKLSIQYLKHAFDRDPENAKPLIGRVASTLIEQIDNLASIATNFSTFARMPEPEPVYFDLRQLVCSVYDLFREEAVEFNLQAEDRLDLVVKADKKLLMRVLNNLIKNAIQAIPEEREGQITVAIQRVDQLARISITDNGTGIPLEMQDQVFVPKFTTKSSGSGLGLAICRDIIKASDGRIYFKTTIGMGSTFFVDLPIVAVSQLFDQLQTDETATV